MSGLQVDIGIPTFRRPNLLAKLLASIAALDRVPGCDLRILVIDNDPDGTASDVANKAVKDLGLNLFYTVEPKRGISNVRNRILDLSEGDVLAFLDDDEVVAHEWLKHMLYAFDRHNADVVFGPVQGLLPSDAPRWATNHPCFDRSGGVTGTEVQLGGCGNVAIKRKWVKDPKFRFDLRFSFTGGEDTDFFHRLNLAGARMIWSSEAVAFEHVPQGRLTFSWVLLRSFRSGQSYAQAVECQKALSSKAWRIIRRILQLILLLFYLPVASLIRPSRMVSMLSRGAGAIGEITAILSLGSPYQEYGIHHYRAGGVNKS